MINAIIEGISAVLNGEFGDGYEIYIEDISQGLEEPCFFIQAIYPTRKLFFGKRYLSTNQFCIQYYPATEEEHRECNDVAERMYRCLEYIAISDDDRPSMGTKMKYEVTDDGVLHFFVNYDCFIRKTEQQEPMETLKASTGVKEGG